MVLYKNRVNESGLRIIGYLDENNYSDSELKLLAMKNYANDAEQCQ